MRFPNLGNPKDLLIWAGRLVLQYERDFNALMPVKGEVTLDTNQATTSVSNAAMRSTKKVVLIPTTANAAAELGAGGLYISDKSDGSFTITHANSATTERTFDYLILG